MRATMIQAQIALIAVGLFSLTACQSSPVSTITNPVAAIQSISPETCKTTFESYIKLISENPEKYQNIQAYPELVQYSETLDQCMDKGHLSQLEMMKAMERVAAAQEGRPADEASVEEAMKTMEEWQKKGEAMEAEMATEQHAE